MNCRSVAEQVWTIAAWPLPPKRSTNEPTAKIARASPAAAEKRGFTAPIVGDVPPGAPSPVRGSAVEQTAQSSYSPEAGRRGMGRSPHWLFGAAGGGVSPPGRGAPRARPPHEPYLG